MADGMPTRFGIPDDRSHIRMLRTFVVEQGGTSTTLGGGRAAALVAILALRLGHSISRTQLIESIWQEGQPDDAGTALRQLVSRARRVLPEGALERIDTPGDTAYRLSRDAVIVDVEEFERLTSGSSVPTDESRRRIDAALALVGDTPFSGLPTLEVFEDARRSIERRVTDLRRDKLVLDAEDCVPAILGALEAALDTSPDDEGLWIATVRYLARTGRAAAAARVASAARRALRNVGMEPGPALRTAERLALDLGSMSAFTPSRLPPATLLFGRQREYSSAIRAIATAARGLVVTFWGAPGMGTSSLLRRLAGEAQTSGTPVGFITDLSGSNHPDGRDAAMVEDICRHLGWTSQDGDALRWLSVVVPTGAILAIDAQLDPVDVAGAVNLLATTWPGPIVVASTGPTGALGEHAIRVGPLAPDAALDFIVERVEQLRVRTLDEVERASLEEICDRSGGIPLVLELCAHQLATRSTADLLTLPSNPDLVTRLDSLIQQLPARAREMAYRLAWIDGDFDAIDAARLVPRPRPPHSDAADQLGCLVRSGLIEFDPGKPGAPYRMLAPISSTLRVSERAIEIRPEAIRRRHITLAARGRRWAEAIGRSEELPALRMLTDRVPALVAATRDPAVASAIRRSLLHSTVHLLLATGRADEAAQFLDLAGVRDTAKADLMADVVATAYALDELELVLEMAERSAHLSLPDCDRQSIGRNAVRTLRNMGRFAEAHRVLDQLSAALDPSQGDEAVSLTMERGMLLVFEDERAQASHLLAEARVDFQRLGVLRGTGACEVYLAWCAWADGHHDRATDLLQRAWDVSIELGHIADDMFCRSTAARFAVERGQFESALEDCRTVERFMRSAHDRLATARILEVRAAAEHGLGMPSDDAAFEAAMIRRRIGAPIAPIELRWMHPDRLLTTA
jgi:DNA-binding SARP family transcriptional activator/tetratricopeptide (TPR) repeat protein